MDFEQLEEREGCAVYMSPVDGGYHGSTDQKACTSSLRGAAYATSEVTVMAEQVTSWDRGFDAEDEQVWGAVEGPYIFMRR